MSSEILEQGKNGAAQIAWACVVYSMVPYLGILFVPFAFAFAAFGYAAAIRTPEIGERRSAVFSLAMSVVVLFAQIFLWWLLFIVPELNRH